MIAVIVQREREKLHFNIYNENANMLNFINKLRFSLNYTQKIKEKRFNTFNTIRNVSLY